MNNPRESRIRIARMLQQSIFTGTPTTTWSHTDKSENVKVFNEERVYDIDPPSSKSVNGKRGQEVVEKDGGVLVKRRIFFFFEILVSLIKKSDHF